MLSDRKGWLENNNRVLELLQPEWDRFEARNGHNIYASSRRNNLKEIAALEWALANTITR